MSNGIFFIIEKIQRAFEKLLSSGILYIILAVIGIIAVILLGIIIFVWVKGEPSPYISESYRLITSNATNFCKERGFNTWKLIGREGKTDLEDRQTENLTFMCFNADTNKTNLNNFFVNQS